jgi:predicted PurR-regulated permease PerM
LFDLLLIPFFVFYLLSDYLKMKARIERWIPPRYRTTGGSLLSQINSVLSMYVRNQLVIAFVMGLLYSFGFAVLRVPLALTIGMISGFLNFVPYLGTLTGLVLAVSFTALDGAGPARLVGVLAVFAIVQSVEGYYLTPKLLGESLNLHPLVVLLGLVIGGNLFGLLGIILAVPVIAAATVILRFVEDNIYQQSEFYQRLSPPLSAGTPTTEPIAPATSPPTPSQPNS